MISLPAAGLPRFRDVSIVLPLDLPVGLLSLTTVIAQVGTKPWLEGGLFALLAGAVLFAICRSSGRN